MWRPVRLVTLLVCGAIGGAALDQIHLRFGVLTYPEPLPGVLGQPWWVELLFGCALVAMLAGATPFARAARPRTPESLVSPYLTGAVWFVAAYLASGLFFRHSIPLAIAYVVLFLARVAWRPDRGPVLLFALLLAAGGIAVEIVVSQRGLFTYARPDLLVPWWLGGLYLHGAPLAMRIADGLDRSSVAPVTSRSVPPSPERPAGG